MRQFKYRAWSVEHKLFEYNIIVGNNNCYKVSRNGNSYPLKNEFKGEIIIQQYTGLKDVNGNEIYEGDILWHTLNVKLGAVYWDEESTSFKIPKNSGGNTGDLFYMYEVKGNIFEK